MPHLGHAREWSVVVIRWKKVKHLEYFMFGLVKMADNDLFTCLKCRSLATYGCSLRFWSWWEGGSVGLLEAIKGVI
ncbi:hypothetical protein E2C01_009916 [Portunus trituberculatus]|uniref:Uncharacterized protein n=1 Tax=Portunus trituberculatus TaxID=210409 RepID=A0A5B7D6Z1_PORTR|nr:hypothetical protein [Portunus trituberculatus]